jgi:hypothetical protein
MGTSSHLATLTPAFEELHGVYAVPLVD